MLCEHFDFCLKWHLGTKKGHKEVLQKYLNKVGKQGRDDSISIQPPYISFFILHVLWEKDLSRGVV